MLSFPVYLCKKSTGLQVFARPAHYFCMMAPRSLIHTDSGKFEERPPGGSAVAAAHRGGSPLNRVALFPSANRAAQVARVAFLFAVTAAPLTAQTFTTLASFNGTNGALPMNQSGSAIVQGPDGNFYGTATSGGPLDAGVVFKMTPEGTLTSLYNFTFGADGSAPKTGVIVGRGRQPVRRDRFGDLQTHAGRQVHGTEQQPSPAQRQQWTGSGE